MSRRAYEMPPLFWSGVLYEWVRKQALAVRGALQGKTNNVRDVTLTASSTTTVFQDALITFNTAAVLSPRTASAAAAVGVLYHEVTDEGELTLHHDSDVATDRTFALVLHG